MMGKSVVRLSTDFLTMLFGGRLRETENEECDNFGPKSGRGRLRNLSSGCLQESS